MSEARQTEILENLNVPLTTLVFDIGIADGTFKPITVPVDCKTILIQIHNGVVTDFTSYENAPLTFHYSTSGSAVLKDYVNVTRQIGISKVCTAGSIAGYVRAAAGGQIVGWVLS